MTTESTRGRRVALLREHLGMPQKELARQAGISVTYLSEIENDKRKMGSDALLRLADALGVSMDYLVKGEEAAPRPKQPVTIPSELWEAADEQQWSVGDTHALLKAHQIVVARRSKTSRNDGRPLTRQEWIQLYTRLFEDDAG